VDLEGSLRLRRTRKLADHPRVGEDL
jgi:hypothetical protein